MASLFETLMLVCFGLSWPINMMKAYRAGTARGTSLPFLLLIITGYIGGITAKLMNGSMTYVLAVYFINLAIVTLNLAVYIRNVQLDKKREAAYESDSEVIEMKSNAATMERTSGAMDFAYAMGLRTENMNAQNDAIETPMDFAYAMGLREEDIKTTINQNGDGTGHEYDYARDYIPQNAVFDNGSMRTKPSYI